jgi:hypothetical protein
MAIKFKAKSKEEIPAELQPLYVEREGIFMLDVEDVVDTARVDEVRSANLILQKEPDDLDISRLSGNGQALSRNT